MSEERYILRNGYYYLSDIEIILDDKSYLSHFEVDRDFRKLFEDYDIACEIRKVIYIETGLDFKVELFRKEEIINE